MKNLRRRPMFFVNRTASKLQIIPLRLHNARNGEGCACLMIMRSVSKPSRLRLHRSSQYKNFCFLCETIYNHFCYHVQCFLHLEFNVSFQSCISNSKVEAESRKDGAHQLVPIQCFINRIQDSKNQKLKSNSSPSRTMLSAPIATLATYLQP